MGLTDEEKTFYDALVANDSAVTAMGHAKLKVIAAELITQVKKSVTIDWTLRESARAKIKARVKRILNKHGHPPDLQEATVKTVLAQAELQCAESGCEGNVGCGISNVELSEFSTSSLHQEGPLTAEVETVPGSPTGG